MDQLAKILDGYIEKKRQKLTALSEEIWRYAEVGYQEFQSAQALERCLEEEGFTVEKGVAEIPTAFVAKYGSGKPIIGFLGEYDALFDLSQQAGNPQRASFENAPAGHGCGHNQLGVGSLAAAMAVKDYMKEHGLPGTVAYYGCPAEEDGSGKMYMAKAGVFDELDGVFTWHPSSKNAVDGTSSLACICVLYRFHGRATHAAGQPHLGRSALDACELMNVGVNYLREHMIQEARVYYAYWDAGGGAPNVVQDHAALYYFIRAPKVYQAMELRERVDNCARGAALMTGTTLEITTTDGLCDFIPNQTLSALLQQGLEEVGAPRFSEADKALAAQFQQGYPAEELKDQQRAYEADYGPAIAQQAAGKSLMDFVLPLQFDPAAHPGSTDVGDVSYVCPTAQLRMATYAIGTPDHSWQLTAQSGCSIGHEGMMAAAKVMAYAGVCAMRDPKVLEKAKEEYVKATGGNYICPVPVDLKPMLDGVK